MGEQLAQTLNSYFKYVKHFTVTETVNYGAVCTFEQVTQFRTL
jgi:hypothetical protein